MANGVNRLDKSKKPAKVRFVDALSLALAMSFNR